MIKKKLMNKEDWAALKESLIIEVGSEYLKKLDSVSPSFYPAVAVYIIYTENLKKWLELDFIYLTDFTVG